jgi:AcrR family transcriptional regulator
MPRGANYLEQIASTALSILEERGADAVTMRTVAKAVGITPMAIYHYFPTREALLKQITDAEFAKLKVFADTRGRRPRSTRDRIVHAIDPYIDYAFARPRIFDYVFSQPRADARRFPEDFRARKSPTLTPVADVVDAAMKDGALKQDDVWEVTLELWAHVHGYICLYRAGRFNLGEQQFRKLVHRSMRRLFDGLKV